MAPKTSARSSPNILDIDDYSRNNEIPLQDAIYLRNPFIEVRDPKKTRFLVFVITGNPGLIEYYRSFMNSLNGNLAKSDGSTSNYADAKNIVFEFYGRSMAGFELGSSAEGESRKRSLPKIMRRKRYHSLREQIDFMEIQLMECVQQLTRSADGLRPKVILIGHSVGSYVLLELIQRHRRRLEKFNCGETTHEKTTSGIRQRQPTQKTLPHNEPDIVGGICLFPTVVDIGQSKQGRILTSLSRIPHFATIVSAVSRALTTIVPLSVLQHLVSFVTGMQGHPASVTTAFISSPRGVKQALYMGADEMRSITADRWDDEVWGAGHVSPLKVARPRLFFYFGEDDHWVADRTRDNLMAVRGRGYGAEDWKPVMEVDQMGVPHGFCIKHSAEVASKCKEYIETIVKLTQKGESSSGKSSEHDTYRGRS